MIGGLFLINTIIFWMLNSFGKSGIENIELGVEFITEVAIPWWLGIFEWFGGLHVNIQVFLIIVFVFILIWIRKDET